MCNATFKNKVFKIIRDDIISNRFSPGQPLNESELSKRLSTSKTPIREAIQLLHKEGFVDFVPQKGAFVSQISLEDYKEIMQIREGLEPIAAGIAAKGHDVKVLSAIEKEFAALSKNSSRDRDAMYELGTRFHIFLIKSTRNRRIIELLDNLRDQMIRIRSLLYLNFTKDFVEKKFDEHVMILHAVKEGNKEKAEVLTREHIRHYWKKIKELA